MGLVKIGSFIVVGIILVLIIGDIIVSVHPTLTDTFAENSIFDVTGPLTFILLSLLGVGFIVGIILKTIKDSRPEPEEFPMRRMSRFDDFEE